MGPEQEAYAREVRRGGKHRAEARPLGAGHGTWRHQAAGMAVAWVLESQQLRSETDPALWRCVRIKQIGIREMLAIELGIGGSLRTCWF